MNTKSIYALLPLDIKEVIVDKLCEVDKDIHSELMEELLYVRREQICDLYQEEMMREMECLDYYEEGNECVLDWLNDWYDTRKEYWDNYHDEECAEKYYFLLITEMCLGIGPPNPFKNYGEGFRMRDVVWEKDDSWMIGGVRLHSIQPSLVRELCYPICLCG